MEIAALLERATEMEETALSLLLVADLLEEDENGPRGPEGGEGQEPQEAERGGEEGGGQGPHDVEGVGEDGEEGAAIPLALEE